MKRISSRMTFFNKVISPVIWSLFGIAFLAGQLSSFVHEGSYPGFFFALMALAVMVAGIFIIRKQMANVVDMVFDAGDRLVVRKGGVEESIPLANIVNLNRSRGRGPMQITVTLREPGYLGKELSFFLSVTQNISGADPFLDKLVERIDAARRAA